MLTAFGNRSSISSIFAALCHLDIALFVIRTTFTEKLQHYQADAANNGNGAQQSQYFTGLYHTAGLKSQTQLDRLPRPHLVK